MTVQLVGVIVLTHSLIWDVRFPQYLSCQNSTKFQILMRTHLAILEEFSIPKDTYWDENARNDWMSPKEGIRILPMANLLVEDPNHTTNAKGTTTKNPTHHLPPNRKNDVTVSHEFPVFFRQQLLYLRGMRITVFWIDHDDRWTDRTMPPNSRCNTTTVVCAASCLLGHCLPVLLVLRPTHPLASRSPYRVSVQEIQEIPLYLVSWERVTDRRDICNRDRIACLLDNKARGGPVLL